MKLQSGAWIAASDECARCGTALSFQMGDRFLAIMRFGEEDIYWRTLDRRTGALTRVEGFPFFAPDGRHMDSAEADEMNTHARDVFDV